MDYFTKEAPFRKLVSKVNNQQSFRDIIYQKTKLPESFSTSPPPRLSIIQSKNPKNSPSLLSKIIKSDHKINSKKIQILKLPKLPFGKHVNYNNEDLFVSNHFIELESSEKTKELDEAIKKFRLFEKRYKKSSISSPDTLSVLEKNKKYFVYKTKAGNLVVNKNRAVIEQYEENRKEYAHLKGLSFQVIPDIDVQVNTERVPSTNRSVSDLVKRLYPEPKKQSNKIFESLAPKFTALFETEESVNRS